MSLHGGNIHKIYREKNIEVLDYSANINPLGVSKNLKKFIKKNIDKLVNYPDPNYDNLKNSISKYINIPKENLIVGNGATEIIFLTMRALKPQKALIICPTFAEYERALEEVEASIDYFELSNDGDKFFIDINILKKELENNYDLVVFCNPNNPTGNFTNYNLFEEILKENYSKTKFLVDEAFIDFMPKGEELSFKNTFSKKLIIIRAFTKFFAIPGLRLGYGICFDNELINKMYKIKEPWTLNYFASDCGEVLLNDEKYIRNSLKSLKSEKSYMLEKFSKMQNIQIYRSETNFLLIKLFKISGAELYEKLLAKGILIRRCENFKFLDDSFIRIAIKDRKSNKKFVKSLKKIMNFKK